MLSQIALVLALLGQTEYKPGDRVYLHSGRGDEVPVVTNFLWVEDFWKSGNAQDAEGMKRLLGDGKMVFLPDDTEALIIQSLPVPNPGPELSFTKVHEVRVKADKYYVFEPWLITPSALAREKAKDVRQVAIAKKARDKAARGKIAKSTLTPEQRKQQIEKNLAKNRQP